MSVYCFSLFQQPVPDVTKNALRPDAQTPLPERRPGPVPGLRSGPGLGPGSLPGPGVLYGAMPRRYQGDTNAIPRDRKEVEIENWGKTRTITMAAHNTQPAHNADCPHMAQLMHSRQRCPSPLNSSTLTMAQLSKLAHCTKGR